MNIRIALLASLVAVAATALTACGGGKSRTNAPSNTAATTAPMGSAGSQNARIPDCGATQAVWVNLNTKVYHEPGDPAYGHTRNGEYLCASQAAAQGFRPVGGAGGRHHRRHHRRTGMAPEAAPTSTY
jgi:hypothetical protein